MGNLVHSVFDGQNMLIGYNMTTINVVIGQSHHFGSLFDVFCLDATFLLTPSHSRGTHSRPLLLYGKL